MDYRNQALTQQSNSVLGAMDDPPHQLIALTNRISMAVGNIEGSTISLSDSADALYGSVPRTGPGAPLTGVGAGCILAALEDAVASLEMAVTANRDAAARMYIRA